MEQLDIWGIMFHIEKWAKAIDAKWYGYCLKSIITLIVIKQIIAISKTIYAIIKGE